MGQQAANIPASSDPSPRYPDDLTTAISDTLISMGYKGDGLQALKAEVIKEIGLQLAPLQELAPRRTPLEIGAINRLEKLRKSQRRPDWTGAGSLSVPERNVAFIGEV